MGRVQDVKLDAAGRITLPKELLEALGFGSRVMVAGRFDRAEIWPLETFEAQQSDEDEREFNDVVRRLGL
jgi:DNA-binding transcriptional regulator/RsmH inhibitor MraZ